MKGKKFEDAESESSSVFGNDADKESKVLKMKSKIIAKSDEKTDTVVNDFHGFRIYTWDFRKSDNGTDSRYDGISRKIDTRLSVGDCLVWDNHYFLKVDKNRYQQTDETGKTNIDKPMTMQKVMRFITDDLDDQYLVSSKDLVYEYKDLYYKDVQKVKYGLKKIYDVDKFLKDHPIEIYSNRNSKSNEELVHDITGPLERIKTQSNEYKSELKESDYDDFAELVNGFFKNECISPDMEQKDGESSKEYLRRAIRGEVWKLKRYIKSEFGYYNPKTYYEDEKQMRKFRKLVEEFADKDVQFQMFAPEFYDYRVKPKIRKELRRIGFTNKTELNHIEDKNNPHQFPAISCANLLELLVKNSDLDAKSICKEIGLEEDALRYLCPIAFEKK